ncbi:hypothetical protein B0H19DRAFT_1158794, partial [Mycena capillaripes]
MLQRLFFCQLLPASSDFSSCLPVLASVKPYAKRFGSSIRCSPLISGAFIARIPLSRSFHGSWISSGSSSCARNEAELSSMHQTVWAWHRGHAFCGPNSRCMLTGV